MELDLISAIKQTLKAILLFELKEFTALKCQLFIYIIF